MQDTQADTSCTANTPKLVGEQAYKTSILQLHQKFTQKISFTGLRLAKHQWQPEDRGAGINFQYFFLGNRFLFSVNAYRILFILFEVHAFFTIEHKVAGGKGEWNLKIAANTRQVYTCCNIDGIG